MYIKKGLKEQHPEIFYSNLLGTLIQVFLHIVSIM